MTQACPTIGGIEGDGKRGVKSPDRAEAVMLAFAECRLAYGLIEYMLAQQTQMDQHRDAKTTARGSSASALPLNRRDMLRQRNW